MSSLFLAGLIVLSSPESRANAAVLRAALDYSHLFEVGDPDLDPVAMHGVGIELCGGYELTELGLVPELAVGFRLFPSDRRQRGFEVNTLWTITTVMAGARTLLRVPETPVRAFAAVHLGMVHHAWQRELLGVRGTGSATYFGFDAGAGAEWSLSESLATGVTIRYGMVVSESEEDETGNGHLVTVAAHVALAL